MIELEPSPGTGSAEITLWAWLLDGRARAPILSRCRTLAPRRNKTSRNPPRPVLPAAIDTAVAEVVTELAACAEPGHRLLIEVFLPDAWLDHPFEALSF